jgi:hypothetical protein
MKCMVISLSILFVGCALEIVYINTVMFLINVDMSNITVTFLINVMHFLKLNMNHRMHAFWFNVNTVLWGGAAAKQCVLGGGGRDEAKVSQIAKYIFNFLATSLSILFWIAKCLWTYFPEVRLWCDTRNTCYSILQFGINEHVTINDGKYFL